MKVLIVESPNKARTIANFLPRDEWIIKASTGHFIDLPLRRHGLREEDNGQWIGEWGVIPGKEDIVKELKGLAVKGNEIYIGTDDDIEGEKIAGDIVEYILIPKGINAYRRVVFHEITKREVVYSLDNARRLDQNAINSQIARRFVDREIGYKMSNIIRWHFKNKGAPLPDNLGIGRTVSPALHLLVEREKEVLSFVEQDKYRVLVEYIKNGIPFRMTVPIDFFDDTQKEMHDLIGYLSNPALSHVVAAYKPETTPKSPYPPLITSRLQRGAWYIYGIEPKAVMKIAQELFHAGLITYHRTDSYNMSDDAVLAIITYLRTKYSDELIVQQKRMFKGKPGSHAAHEAIRPTCIVEEASPENIEDHPLFVAAKLTKQHAEVYSYIWYVAVSTQMADALYDTSTAIMQVGQVKLLGNSNAYALGWSEDEQMVVPQYGWHKLYGQFIEPAEEEDETTFKGDTVLPRLKIGETISMLDVKVVHTTTRRPPRYGIGRFITTLENKKIGRPSTFATIYEKLVATKVVSIKNNNLLIPTALGMSIDDWVSENANWLNSIDHTVEFHDRLELVEKGEISTPDPIVKEYSQLVSEVAKAVGWIDPDTLAPSKEQIDFAKRIIAEKGIRGVDTDSLFSSRAKMRLFLDAHPLPKKISLGKCPACKTGEVFDHIYTKQDNGEELPYFSCSDSKCGFRVWENNLDAFFVRFKKDFTKEELRSAIGNILSKRSGYQFFDFISKDNEAFHPLVIFEQSIYKGKPQWGLKLKFCKSDKK